MSRRRPHRKRSRKSDSFPLGWAAFATFVFAAIIGGFLWVYHDAVRKNPERDPDSLCPLAGPTEQIIVLVDMTDPIAAVTRQDILNRLDEVARDISKGGRFELRIMEPSKRQTSTIFTACNPGDGSDLAHWTGNPAMAKRRWQERFDAPLRAAMDAALQAAEAQESPIMAALQEIAVQRLGTMEASSIPSRLIAISDMLENTGAFSIYRTGPDYSAYKNSRAAKEFATDFAGANVEFWLVRREMQFSNAAVAEFWANWAQDNNGRFLRALQLMGLSP